MVNGEFSVLTVEEMLVLLLSIQVATVLLDSINAELGRVDRLGTKVVSLEGAVDLGLGVVIEPKVMNLSTLDDVIPLMVGMSGSGLWGGAHRLLLESLDGIGHEERDLVPDSLGLGGDLTKEVFEGGHP